MPNAKAIRDLLIFVLAKAEEQDDWRARELGPIHLLKVAYLADVHAAKAGLPSFTGIDWVFLHFGPWSGQGLDCLTQTANEVGSPRAVHDSFGERTRWRARHDPYALQQATRGIPAPIRIALASTIARYGNATPELLEAVYGTEPMTTAAPGEPLDFSGLHRPMQVHQTTPDDWGYQHPSPTKRKKKLKALRAKVAARTASPPGSLKKVLPVNDNHLDQLLQLMDEQEGQIPSSFEVVVDERVWHSKARANPENTL